MCIHRAVQYLQNVLTEFSYLLINFCHLSLTFELGSRQGKYPWHSLISSIFELLNNFMHIRLYVKSRECRSPLLSWHDSRPYKRMGIHFLVITAFIIIFIRTTLSLIPAFTFVSHFKIVNIFVTLITHSHSKNYSNVFNTFELQKYPILNS